MTKELITRFYTSFSNGNATQMIDCYHENIVFEDPAFGKLKGERAAKMWEMLLSKNDSQLEVSFKNIKTTETRASVDWIASYLFGPKKRKVINEVHANFVIEDGKIIQHIDDFDVWKWSKQALGTTGALLGWTPFIKTEIQKKANKSLDEFIQKNK